MEAAEYHSHFMRIFFSVYTQLFENLATYSGLGENNVSVEIN